MSNLANVSAVLPVTDHAAAVAWYTGWIGRAPDVTPTDGVAEWMIADNAWIQVAQAPDPAVAGKSSVVIGVNDFDGQLATLAAAEVKTGETQDYGFIKLTTAADPDGNQVNFVWTNPDFDPSVGA